MAKINWTVSNIESELSWSYARSGGAGGQNVNKVASKAVVRWDVQRTHALPPAVKERFLERFASKLTTEGELIVTSEKFRDQGRNAADCLMKLQAMVEQVWFAPKARRATKPTRSSVRKRLEAKKKRGEHKQGRSKVRWD